MSNIGIFLRCFELNRVELFDEITRFIPRFTLLETRSKYSSRKFASRQIVRSNDFSLFFLIIFLRPQKCVLRPALDISISLYKYPYTDIYVCDCTCIYIYHIHIYIYIYIYINVHKYRYVYTHILYRFKYIYINI